MDIIEVSYIINAYGEACRNDWSSINGKEVCGDMENIADAVRNPEGISGAELLSRLDLCPMGSPHWCEHCDDSCTP